mgnify:CR=1 FL=1
MAEWITFVTEISFPIAITFASYRRKTGYAERINPFVTRENEIKIRADSSSEMRRGVLVHCVKNIRKVLLFIRKET